MIQFFSIFKLGLSFLQIFKEKSETIGVQPLEKFKMLYSGGFPPLPPWMEVLTIRMLKNGVNLNIFISTVEERARSLAFHYANWQKPCG